MVAAEAKRRCIQTASGGEAAPSSIPAAEATAAAAEAAAASKTAEEALNEALAILSSSHERECGGSAAAAEAAAAAAAAERSLRRRFTFLQGYVGRLALTAVALHLLNREASIRHCCSCCSSNNNNCCCCCCFWLLSLMLLLSLCLLDVAGFQVAEGELCLELLIFDVFWFCVWVFVWGVYTGECLWGVGARSGRRSLCCVGWQQQRQQGCHVCSPRSVSSCMDGPGCCTRCCLLAACGCLPLPPAVLLSSLCSQRDKPSRPVQRQASSATAPTKTPAAAAVGAAAAAEGGLRRRRCICSVLQLFRWKAAARVSGGQCLSTTATAKALAAAVAAEAVVADSTAAAASAEAAAAAAADAAVARAHVCAGREAQHACCCWH